ncbi:MAG: phospholipid carrier-dependent glycosyltransferase, partial [Clostridia bacterium]|nr:phospholipid carrier-dependent glycosyltransferase [Clostridia bacterium]
AKVVEARNANADSPLLSDPANLLDEQGTLEGEPSWYNSTYFDEIYHARTAFEHLNGTQPYETSHPPLGKVIMSWFVGIFGMTPFGWRFAGALAGILMLPAMYVLGKQLTKRTGLAFAAMLLMAVDCMHFTQTRIATIDSFPVLFIILSYLFMLRFMQRDIVLQPMKKLLPDLAFCGFFMGCGVASKWIGAYAGVGLALLYFWTCFRHINLSVERGDGKAAWKRVMFLCLWCLLFFVAIPLTIYLLSYIPYFAYAHIEGISDFLERVWRTNFGDPVYSMFAYHSTPGMGMDHPFYSPWYEWPLIQRPMYYAMASFTPEGYSFSIFCFGNPAVWLVGLAGVAVTLAVWFKRHCYVLEGNSAVLHWYSTNWSVEPAFVLIGLLAQFLPWVLVPRGTYIYHYFASIPFLILGTVLMFYWLCQKAPRVGRILLISYLILSVLFFVAYYPYASGVLTPEWWLDFMKQFMRVYYA